LCAPFAAEIEGAVAAGLSAQRIYQDLISEHGFGGGYSSVKLFVRRLTAKAELLFRRMECEPKAEMQVDFGTGAWVVAEGKRRRPHLFRAVLNHSRKGYSEVVWRQDTETVIRCLENAFRAFGGVTVSLVAVGNRSSLTSNGWPPNTSGSPSPLDDMFRNNHTSIGRHLWPLGKRQYQRTL
jgi:transposase